MSVPDIGSVLAYGGKVIGGWEYVWAAYGISWVASALYAASLFLRRRAQVAKEAQ